MRRLAILLCFVIAGCSSGDDAKVVGLWHGEKVFEKGKAHPGADLTLDKDHRFRDLFGNMEVEGAWSLAGSTLELRIERVNGLPVAEAKNKMLTNADRAADPAAVRSFAEGMDRPVTLILSEDGKRLRSKIGKAMVAQDAYTKE